MAKNAVVMWSGGKDCNLALELAKEEGLDIVALLTFHSPATEFRAHSKELMNLQSKSIGIPHLMYEIQEPFAQNYELQLQKVKEQLHIEVLVSGDISEVHGNSNWLSDRAKAVGLETFLPLWHQERSFVLDELNKRKFDVILTMVKEPWFTSEFVGRRLDQTLISDLKAIANLDLCGEKGEYHTMVLNGPSYRSPITIHNYEVVQHEEMMHMNNIVATLNGEYTVPVLEKHKRCVVCGIDFSCYTAGCWCAELPMIMPMENITDCMCPKCLKNTINEKLIENNREPLA